MSKGMTDVLRGIDVGNPDWTNRSLWSSILDQGKVKVAEKPGF
jgi:hypothetical protein